MHYRNTFSQHGFTSAQLFDACVCRRYANIICEAEATCQRCAIYSTPSKWSSYFNLHKWMTAGTWAAISFLLRMLSNTYNTHGFFGMKIVKFYNVKCTVSYLSSTPFLWLKGEKTLTWIVMHVSQQVSPDFYIGCAVSHDEAARWWMQSKPDPWSYNSWIYRKFTRLTYTRIPL